MTVSDVIFYRLEIADLEGDIEGEAQTLQSVLYPQVLLVIDLALPRAALATGFPERSARVR